MKQGTYSNCRAQQGGFVEFRRHSQRQKRSGNLSDTPFVHLVTIRNKKDLNSTFKPLIVCEIIRWQPFEKITMPSRFGKNVRNRDQERF